jgi:soluble lytic murein transglycosylase
MAQQLATTRSAQAYSGVLNYAHTHTGEAAAAAWLALGHAYWLDKRYADAYNSFQLVRSKGVVLNDYAEYLGAESALQQGRAADAVALLTGFTTRYKQSIFTANAPVKLAEAYLQLNDPQSALHTLAPYDGQSISGQPEFLYTEARAYQAIGNTAQATTLYRKLVATQPLSAEAASAETQLQTLRTPLSITEHKALADALFAAKHYADALVEYRDLEHDPAAHGAGNFAVYAAACELKLKDHRLNRPAVEQLPDSNDDAGALRLYILAELDRDADDRADESKIVQQMVQRFPASSWLHEALYSAGNAAWLKQDAPEAIRYYTTLVNLFPNGTYAPSSHWRAVWMNYRLRNYSDASRLFDEQLTRYSGGLEIPAALYWRARIYEDQEHNYAQAENYYRTLTQCYTNYYYAILARQRLTALSAQSPTQTTPPAAPLAFVKLPHPPALSDALPEDDEHLEKARLLANAALNEYIPAEIQLSAGSATWGIYAQAQLYASFNEDYRALQEIKKAGSSFFSVPIQDVPLSYWHLLFPLPYWSDLYADATRNNLDPYLVAALIRQESEFNPGIISHADAYGLMQLLPSVGRQLARKDGVRRLDPSQLLQPTINLRYGSVYLRSDLDHYSNQPELALAAYNAGDTIVHDWQAAGNFKDLPEFVESIPYTETRDYVQAVLRNQEMYHQLYAGEQQAISASVVR